MARPIDPRIAEILKTHGEDPNDRKGVVWDCHGTWVVYHAAIERVAARAGIQFDTPHIVEANAGQKIATICVTGRMGERVEWSFGEASPGNNKNSYPWAMAEKRAKDRVALKLLNLHGLVYSEEEADDFKPGKTGAIKGGVNPGDESAWDARTDDMPELNLTQIRDRGRDFAKDLASCLTEDELNGLLQAKETIHLFEQMRVKKPDWYNGNGGDIKGIQERIDHQRQTIRELAEQSRNVAA